MNCVIIKLRKYGIWKNQTKVVGKGETNKRQKEKEYKKIAGAAFSLVFGPPNASDIHIEIQS